MKNICKIFYFRKWCLLIILVYFWINFVYFTGHLTELWRLEFSYHNGRFLPFPVFMFLPLKRQEKKREDENLGSQVIPKWNTVNQRSIVEKINDVDGSSCEISNRFSHPVDIVFTWVNGSDQNLIDTMKLYLPEGSKIQAKRFRDWGNLKYALRSVQKYADWINRVYIVTNGQVPNWLNTGYQKVSIVKHSEIFKNLSHLPTFNAQTIECHIHRIPGLSESFLYMNDDFFFGQPVELQDFYTKETGFKIRFGAEKVPDYMGKCNKFIKIKPYIRKQLCKYIGCGWDGKRCYVTSQEQSKMILRNGPFLGSLVYTSLAFDKAFGHAQRKVPAHAPYIIHIDTLNALMNRFQIEWERTSANRFRDPHTFQYGFAYYHFLLKQKANACGGEKIHPIATFFTRYEDYTYFATGNASRLERSLNDLLRKKNKKFVCINDHMGNGISDEEVARNGDVITKFFEEYFPERSEFEN